MKKSVGSFSIVSWIPWILYILALLSTFYLMSKGLPFWGSYLLSVVFFNGGVQGIWAAIGHLFFPARVAQRVGWVEHYNLQRVLGFANLGIGVTGLLSLLYPFWALPVGLIVAIFFGGCAFVHITEHKRNKTGCHCGPMLYNLILVSITLLIAVIMVMTGN